MNLLFLMVPLLVAVDTGLIHWIAGILGILLLVTLGVMVLVLNRGRKRDRKALQRMEEKNEEIAQLKNAFIANMTHELRTPLNAIVGFSEMLEMEGLDSETRRMCVKEINDNKVVMLQLISDLLDYSRIESNTMEYHDEDTDVQAVIDEICMKEHMRLGEGAAVEVSTVERMPQCRLRVDKMRFAQVMKNLVSNALKFTEQGSVRVGCRRLENGKFYFYVIDTGCGIDEAARHAIFDRFVKMSQHVKGTGLGLSITRSIVEHYGGGIGVESRKGEGSTFYFTLPGSLLYREHGKF